MTVEKTIKKYIDADGLKHYHERAQQDLAAKDFQSDADVKASISYHYRNTIKKEMVAKEDGKGLSSNDFTDEEKKKLAGLNNVVPEGLTADQVAKINAAITQTDLDEGGYQTSDDVNALILAAKNEIFAKGYQDENDVRTLLAASQHLARKLVTSSDDIDATAQDAEKYIYLVPLYTEDNTIYSEWVVVEGQAVMIGTGFTNLDDYWSKNELFAITASELEAILI